MNASYPRPEPDCASRAREMILRRGLPQPLEERLQVDLRDAVRRGFHVDLEQLELTLKRLDVP